MQRHAEVQSLKSIIFRQSNHQHLASKCSSREANLMRPSRCKQSKGITILHDRNRLRPVFRDRHIILQPFTRPSRISLYVCVDDLVIVQQGSSLLIGRNNSLISAQADFLAEDTRDGNDESGKKEGSHDGKCKDPLECNSLGEKLTDAKSSSEVAECKAHSIVLFLSALSTHFFGRHTLKIIKKNSP